MMCDGGTGISCERTVCPNDCSGRGICYTAKQLAVNAGSQYDTVWDSMKQVGCVCDLGYRGPDCSLREYHPPITFLLLLIRILLSLLGCTESMG